MTRKISAFILSANAMVWILPACASVYKEAPGPVAVRPSSWAVPLQVKAAPNCFKVSEELYRGAQPEREGFLELKKMGIKTIVNLREHDSDVSLLEGTGLNYFHIPTDTTRPERNKYQKVLDIAANPGLQPVFIHCYHGADRTGTAVALYRITVQQWDTEEAIRELQQGGYGYHSIFREIINFIKDFKNRP